MRRHGQPITIERLPRSHKELKGLYAGETATGCPFEIYVLSGQRRASGNDLVRAQVRSMTTGRPMTNSDLYVPHDEIYVIIGNHHRKDIRINLNGTYAYGSIFGRTFREVVENMIEAFAPKLKREEPAEPTSTSPKPF